MRSSTIITSIFALATAVSGATVNKQRGVDRSHDGVYTSSGKVADLKTASKRRDVSNTTITLARDEFKGVGCDNDDQGTVGMDPDLTSQAESTLIDWCNENGCNDSVWAKAGFSVVFYCKWRDANWNSDSFNHALSMIDSECANNNGGSYSNDDEAHRDYSYGVTDWSRKGWCNLAAGYPF